MFQYFGPDSESDGPNDDSGSKMGDPANIHLIADMELGAAENCLLAETEELDFQRGV